MEARGTIRNDSDAKFKVEVTALFLNSMGQTIVDGQRWFTVQPNEERTFKVTGGYNRVSADCRAYVSGFASAP
jgi:hypothetical protein